MSVWPLTQLKSMGWRVPLQITIATLALSACGGGELTTDHYDYTSYRSECFPDEGDTGELVDLIPDLQQSFTIAKTWVSDGRQDATPDGPVNTVETVSFGYETPQGETAAVFAAIRVTHNHYAPDDKFCQASPVSTHTYGPIRARNKDDALVNIPNDINSNDAGVYAYRIELIPVGEIGVSFNAFRRYTNDNYETTSWIYATLDRTLFNADLYFMKEDVEDATPTTENVTLDKSIKYFLVP